MKFRRWWIGVTIVFALVAILGVRQLNVNDDDTAFANATCNPTTSTNLKLCIESRFRQGVHIDTLRRYVRGADFIWWATKLEQNIMMIKFILIKDNEFGPRRIAIVVAVENDIIQNISVRDQEQIEGW